MSKNKIDKRKYKWYDFIMKVYFYNREKVTDEYIRESIGDSKAEVLRTAKGKPYLENGPFVSVSHTGDIVVVAVSESEIGIDAERKDREVKKQEELIRKYFSERETEYANTREKFLEIWTKKESYGKFTGEGLGDIGKDVFSHKGRYEKIEKDGYIIFAYREDENDL